MINIPEPFELRALLAKMKGAREQGVNMNVHPGEIKAVSDAIAAFEAIRAIGTKTAPSIAD